MNTWCGCRNTCKLRCWSTIDEHVVRRALTTKKTMVASAMFSDTSVVCIRRRDQKCSVSISRGRNTRSLSDARKIGNQSTCETHLREQTRLPLSHGMTCSRDDLRGMSVDVLYPECVCHQVMATASTSATMEQTLAVTATIQKIQCPFLGRASGSDLDLARAEISLIWSWIAFEAAHAVEKVRQHTALRRNGPWLSNSTAPDNDP